MQKTVLLHKDEVLISGEKNLNPKKGGIQPREERPRLVLHPEKKAEAPPPRRKKKEVKSSKCITFSSLQDA